MALALSVIILGERVDTKEIVNILIVVTAVLLILIGMQKSTTEGVESTTYIAIISLAMLPLT